MVKTLTGMLTNVAAGAVFIAVLCAAVSCLLFALAPEGSASADERRYSDGTFMGAGSFVTETETVNYARKSVTTKRIASSFPAYYNTASGVTDNCAGVAGAILMGYYDRYHADLIPGTATGTGRLVYTYYPQSQISSYIQAVINDFYSRMNVGQEIVIHYETKVGDTVCEGNYAGKVIHIDNNRIKMRYSGLKYRLENLMEAGR